MGRNIFDWSEHLALFGGAFDPPHIGHQKAIEGLFRNPGVECVMLVPTWSNPIKTSHTPYPQRFEMTKLLAESLTQFPIEINPIERDLKIRNSDQLLTEIRKQTDDSIAMVIGTDQFENLSQWVNYPAVMGQSDWLVLQRKNASNSPIETTLKKYIAAGWLRPHPRDHSGRNFLIEVGGARRQLELVSTDAPDINSTQIRTSISLGQTTEVQTKLQPNIYQFIERNKIYGPL